MLTKELDVCDQIPGGIRFQARMWSAAPRSPLIEEDNAVGVRIEELPVFGQQTGAWTTMKKESRLAVRISALFVIKLMNGGNFETPCLKGFNRRV